jgi:hypothetical protein
MSTSESSDKEIYYQSGIQNSEENIIQISKFQYVQISLLHKIEEKQGEKTISSFVVAKEKFVLLFSS